MCLIVNNNSCRKRRGNLQSYFRGSKETASPAGEHDVHGVCTNNSQHGEEHMSLRGKEMILNLFPLTNVLHSFIAEMPNWLVHHKVPLIRHMLYHHGHQRPIRESIRLPRRAPSLPLPLITLQNPSSSLENPQKRYYWAWKGEAYLRQASGPPGGRKTSQLQQQSNREVMHCFKAQIPKKARKQIWWMIRCLSTAFGSKHRFPVVEWRAGLRTCGFGAEKPMAASITALGCRLQARRIWPGSLVYGAESR